jgi:hypothetical protein
MIIGQGRELLAELGIIRWLLRILTLFKLKKEIWEKINSNAYPWVSRLIGS